MLKIKNVIVLVLLSSISLGHANDLQPAIKSDDLGVVKKLLAPGAIKRAFGVKPKYEVKNKNGETPLIQAAIFDADEVLSWLLKMGADVNAKDNFDETALMKAADRGHMLIVRELIKAKADPNAKNKRGVTALMKAADYGDSNIVELLLNNGANINDIDNFGDTAIAKAVNNGRKKGLLKTLLYWSLRNAIKLSDQDVALLIANQVLKTADDYQAALSARAGAQK